MDQNSLSFQEVEKILRIIDAAPREGAINIKVGDLKLSVTKGAADGGHPATAAPQPVAPAPEHLPGADAADQPQGSANAEVATPAAAPTQTRVSVSESESAPAGQADAKQMPDDPAGTTHTVVAPLTGVFYRQPSPGAPPFVVEGQRVEAGDVLAIIEVMKLMNRLTAPTSGIVTQIFVENEDLIEHGNALFVIDEAVDAE